MKLLWLSQVRWHPCKQLSFPTKIDRATFRNSSRKLAQPCAPPGENLNCWCTPCTSRCHGHGHLCGTSGPPPTNLLQFACFYFWFSTDSIPFAQTAWNVKVCHLVLWDLGIPVVRMGCAEWNTPDAGQQIHSQRSENSLVPLGPKDVYSNKR